ncbi:MAG: SMC family ATPase, partial [Thermoleophilia bacterium]|nr:SMC family ATPase [Thermoleophilia bacterium]
MRPTRLELAGFTAFREPQEVDLEDLELFCITGPTGAGKTTLFDAITFALYGQAPRVGRRVSQLIANGCTEARVRLDFAAGEDRYRITRRLTAAGQRPLLERLAPDGSATPLAGSVRAVAEEVERIVGLGFDFYTRAAMLPQGRFAELLTGSPSQRRDILSRLLDLDRYRRAGERARGGARDHGRDAATLDGILERQYAGVTPDALAGAERAAAAAAGAAAALAALRDRVVDLAGAGASATAAAQAAGRAGGALVAVAGELADATGALVVLEPRRQAALRALAEADAACARADADRAGADAALAATIAEGGDEALLAALAAAAATRAAAQAREASAGPALGAAREAAGARRAEAARAHAAEAG